VSFQAQLHRISGEFPRDKNFQLSVLTVYIGDIRCAAMKHGEPTVPIPVRLDERTRGRLDKAAKKMGSTRSSMIRFAVLNQLPQIEAGKITLAAETEAA
jgi:hypothetical protein